MSIDSQLPTPQLSQFFSQERCNYKSVEKKCTFYFWNSPFQKPQKLKFRKQLISEQQFQSQIYEMRPLPLSFISFLFILFILFSFFYFCHFPLLFMLISLPRAVPIHFYHRRYTRLHCLSLLHIASITGSHVLSRFRKRKSGPNIFNTIYNILYVSYIVFKHMHKTQALRTSTIILSF